MEKTSPTDVATRPDDRITDTRPAATPGPCWMVWLQDRAAADPSTAWTGSGGTRRVHRIGRCLFATPADGVGFSWCRRDGRAGLVYGHLFNPDELRQRLRIPAASGPSDAELLLAAYEVWGRDAPRELDGTYAAIVWDEAEETLLCVRDPIGVIPAFYARTGAGLVISSDIWTVLRHPAVSGEVNRLVLAEHLLWHHSDVEETLFESVRRLPGAHCLQVRRTDLAVFRYWDPLPPPGQPIDWLHSSELERFPALMRRTIAACMALGPSGIAQSAGIDSVSVATFAAEVAAEHAWPNPHALALYDDDPSSDDSVGQVGVARALEMPLHLFTLPEALGGRPLLDAMMALSPSYPSPLSNIWAPSLAHLTQTAASQGIRAILTGIGGDEWLGVPLLLAADLVRAGNLVGLWRLYQAHLRSYEADPLLLARDVLWRFGLREVLREAAYRHASGLINRRHRPVGLPDWIAPDPELRRKLHERVQPPPPQPRPESGYLWEMRPQLQAPRVSMQMEEFFYRGRPWGVSFVHPYWSRPVVEFLVRTPPHLLNSGGRSKGFVRRLLAERFPKLDIAKQKKITRSPLLERLIAQQWPGIWRRWASDSALARAGVVEAPRLEAAMESAVASQKDIYVPLWLSTEAWLRAYQ
jgi:asparagine synthase (glutamine-hydrolysing)